MGFHVPVPTFCLYTVSTGALYDDIHGKICNADNGIRVEAPGEY